MISVDSRGGGRLWGSLFHDQIHASSYFSWDCWYIGSTHAKFCVSRSYRFRTRVLNHLYSNTKLCGEARVPSVCSDRLPPGRARCLSVLGGGTQSRICGSTHPSRSRSRSFAEPPRNNVARLCPSRRSEDCDERRKEKRRPLLLLARRPLPAAFVRETVVPHPLLGLERDSSESGEGGATSESPAPIRAYKSPLVSCHGEFFFFLWPRLAVGLGYKSPVG